MASRITGQTPSIAAGATVSLMQVDVNAQKLRSSTEDRVLVGVALVGATVNTGEMKSYVGNEEIHSTPNGVTNTAGAVIRQDDVTPLEELVGANENFDVQVKNTSAGALQYFYYMEFQE